MVIAETRLPKPVDMSFFFLLIFGGIVQSKSVGSGGGVCGRDGNFMVGLVVLTVQDDGPAGREDVASCLEVVGLEADAAEDGRDG